VSASRVEVDLSNGLTGTGTVLNVFEAVDVITLIKGGVYDDLNLSVGDALLKRSDVRPHPSH
jgi:5'-AMP-activated protein kinase regulatory gamma subunit